MGTRPSTSILDYEILPTFGGMKLVSLRREAIERWQAARLADVAGGTANKELMRLKHLLNRAVARNYLRASPARTVKKAKEAPGRVRYLTAEDFELLLNGRAETVTAKDGRTWTVYRGPSPACASTSWRPSRPAPAEASCSTSDGPIST